MTNNATNPELTMDLRDYFVPTVRSGALASTLILSGGVAAAKENSKELPSDYAAWEELGREMEAKPYTIKSGDFRLLMAPQLGIRYNDNVSVSTVNQQEDWILRPAMQFTASYPIGKRNLFLLD